MAPARVVENWVLSKFLGEGGFGKVWLGYHAKYYCMRVIKEIQIVGTGDEVKNEVEALRTLRGPNIVHMVDAFENNGSMFIVMEYCRGGDLWQYLNARGAIDEDTCRYFIRQLAEGLKVLRKDNIVHRDLKPSNLLLSDDGPAPTLKIADFGIAAAVTPEGLPPSFCGTVPYSAPEMQLGPYGAESDLWSVGVIMYELLTGVCPFQGDNYYDLMESVKKDKVKLPGSVAMKLTPGCRHLVYSLLKRDPANRISFDDFFSHPFLESKEASAAMSEDAVDEAECDMCEEDDEAIANQGFDFIYNEAGYDMYARDEDCEDELLRQCFHEIYKDADEADCKEETILPKMKAAAQEKEKEPATAAAASSRHGPSGFILPPPLHYLVMLRQEMLQKDAEKAAATGEDSETADGDKQLQHAESSMKMNSASPAERHQAAEVGKQAHREEEPTKPKKDRDLLQLQQPFQPFHHQHHQHYHQKQQQQQQQQETAEADHDAWKAAERGIHEKVAPVATTAAGHPAPPSLGSNLPLPLQYLVKLRHEMLQKNVHAVADSATGIKSVTAVDGNQSILLPPAKQLVGATEAHVRTTCEGKCGLSPKPKPDLQTSVAIDCRRPLRLQNRLRGAVWRYFQHARPLRHGWQDAHDIAALALQPKASRRRHPIRRVL